MLDPVPQARTRHAVACQYHACRHAAAMVELLPGPRSGHTLMVSGFTAESDESDVAAPMPDPELVALVSAGDPGLAAALYERDPAWAPFFCPVCERSYCTDHWQGTRCPYGH